MLTAMSSAMIYGLLPVFLVKALGISIASIGLIEGVAEASTSLITIASGALSDWVGRRKPLVVFGYTLSAITKTIFPIAGTAFAVLVARVIDRMGKGIRDAPRDAFLADLITQEIRGAGFGLRLALAVSGFVVGPLIAVVLMKLSGDDFRLVFWIALIPAYLSTLVLLVVVREFTFNHDEEERLLPISRKDVIALPAAFWWVIVIASLLSLARFSLAFLVLKAQDIGVDAAYVPLVLVVMHLVFSLAAYPFGILADHVASGLPNSRRPWASLFQSAQDRPSKWMIAGAAIEPSDRSAVCEPLLTSIFRRVPRERYGVSDRPNSPAASRGVADI